MFCYNVNPNTNDIYAMTHSCNPDYTCEMPVCPYANSKECNGFCGLEDDFEEE